jgi:hypothetical protein
VESLIALSNRWDTLAATFGAGLFGNVVNLNLSHNQLLWDEVLHLGSLPKLETLKLIANPIDEIAFPSDFAGFPALKLLNIEETQINSWVSVFALNAMNVP